MRKNKKIYIALILFIACFLFVGEANAKKIQICGYEKSGQGANAINWDDSSDEWNAKSNGNAHSGSYTTTFKNLVVNSNSTFETFKSGTNKKQNEEFVCPSAVCEYKSNYNLFTNGDISSCPSRLNLSQSRLDKFFDIKPNVKLIETRGRDYSIFDDIDSTFFTSEALTQIASEIPSSAYMTNKDINGQWTNTKDIISASAAQVIYTKIKEKYGFSKNKSLPRFIQTHVTLKLKDDANANKILTDKFNEKLNADHDAGTISDEVFEEKNDIVNNNYNWGSGTGITITKEYRERVNTSYGSNVKDPTTDINCNSILGTEMTKLVENVLKFIRFLGPVLVIVLTIIDFVSAVFSADLSITKPLGKLIRRLIAAALLFFLPTIIIPLFNYLHITMSDTCMQFLQ